jgi:hypothetical protein
MGFDFDADSLLAHMHGYAAANGLSDDCRVNRHEECVDGGCVCACHAGEGE